jgi:hypothetical protein
MAKHTNSTSPFEAMEQEAYHAFLEWPVWLALREKELASYLDAPSPHRPQTDPRAAAAAGAGDQPVKEN